MRVSMGGYRRCRIAIALSAMLCGATAQAADVTWLGAAAQPYWDLSANWSPALPTAADQALLGSFDTEFRSGSVTVLSFTGTGQLRVSGGGLAVTEASSIGSLLISAGALGGAGNRTVTGDATWTGGAFTGSASSTFINGALSISGAGGKSITAGHTLSAASTTWSGNTANNNNAITMSGGSHFANSGTFTDSNAFNSLIGTSSGGGSFDNSGTFNKQSNTTTAIGAVFNNSGTVNVNAGTLLPSGGGTSSGAFVIAAGALLEFRNGNHTLDNATTSGAGTLQISTDNVGADAFVTINGGTHTSAFLLSGSTLGGTDHSFQGAATWTGGTITGAASTTFAGALAISGPGTKSITGGRAVSAGSTTWSGNTADNNNAISLSGGSTFSHTGTFTDANAFDSSIGAGNGGGAFTSNGTFDKQSNTTTSISAAFNSTGTVNVNAGTLLLHGGGTSSAVFNLAAGTKVEYRNGNHTLNNVTMTGAGLFQVSTDNVGADAIVTLNGGTLTAPFLLSGSTVAGTDQVFKGPATWTGGALSGAASTTFDNDVTISGPNLKTMVGGRVVNLNATTTWSGNTGDNNNAIRFWNGATVNNNGTFVDANAFASFIEHNVGGPHNFNNLGTYNKQSNTITTVDGGVAFNNSGVVNINAGTFRPTGGTSTGVFNIADGATLEFINGSSTLDQATTAGAGLLKISTDNVGADAVLSVNGGTHTTALLIAGSTLAGVDATFQGPVTWTGGAINGASSTTFTNAVSITGNAAKRLVSARVLNLQGTTTWSGNTSSNGNAISLWNAPQLVNQGTFNDENAFNSFIENFNGGGTFVNSGTYNKQSNTLTTVELGVGFQNSGTVNINAGTMTFGSGTQGPTGTVQVASGATYQHGANSTVGRMVTAGTLALSTRSLTVHIDYDNANFGVGNAFDARANVTGTGQILAAGTAAATQRITGAGLPAGSSLSGGDGATPILTIGNVHVGANALVYQVSNANIGGPALRGAIQTTVGGANISDARLSGSGVSAGNFGPIAPGASAGFEVVFNAADAGVITTPLTGQAVRIANNFDNVAEQNLSIVLASGAAAYHLASAADVKPNPVDLGAQRAGGTASAALTIANSAPAGNFTEKLNAGFGAVTGSVLTNGGAVNGLAGGASNGSSMTVRLDGTVAGTKSGTVQVAFASDGAGSSGLGLTALPSQTISVGGRFYAPAVAQLDTPAVDFGIVHKGDTVAARSVSVSNVASVAELNDVLVGSLGGASAPFTASGTLAGVNAQATDSSSLKVQLDTAQAGVFNGSANASFASHNAEMSDLALPGATVTLQAQVNNFAELALGKTGGAGSFSSNGTTYTLDFGTRVQGAGTLDAALAIFNVATGPADLLNGSFAVGPDAGFTLSGFEPFAGIAAGQSQGGLSVSFGSGGPGTFRQTIVVSAFGSNASGFEGALPDATLVLVGTVVAVPEPQTMALLCGGLLGVWCAVRRRRDSP